MNKYSIDDPLVWQKISAEKLKSHIFNGHIRRPYVLRRFGIPTFDVELAKYRRYESNELSFDLTDIARKSLEVVVNYSDTELFNFNLNSEEIGLKYTIAEYRKDIINSIRYMRDLKLTEYFRSGEHKILDVYFDVVPFEFGGHIQDIPFKPKYDPSEISHYEELARQYDDFLEVRENITTVICGNIKK